MTSAHVDIDSELKNMVMSFRVSELQELLSYAGCNKSGRKHDLMTKALQLIRSQCTKTVQAKVFDLYGRRFPHAMKKFHEPYPSIFGNIGTGRPDMMHHNNNSGPGNLMHKERSGVNVKFVPLPFYELVSEVLRPTELVCRSSKSMKEDQIIFKMNPDHVRDVFDGDFQKFPRKSMHVQLRFCLLETSCEQNDHLPQHLSLKVNRMTANLPPSIPPTKAGVEPRMQNLPINITDSCHKSAFSDNVLDIRWSSPPGKRYTVTVNIVRQLTADKLYEQLKRRPTISAEKSRAIIRQKLSRDLDSDISTTSLEISMLCPLGMMRMKLPCRPITCTHLQCFDAMLFLRMNERKPTWQCPVCDKPATFSNLVIDDLLVKILEKSDSDEITFTDEGDWHSSKKKTETLVIGNTPMKPIGSLRVKEAVVSREPPRPLGGASKSVLQRRKAAKKKKFAKLRKKTFGRVKIADLSRNAPIHLDETEKKKKPEPEIIDLTCDSSDDEPSIPLKAVPMSRSPVQISDDTPMSVSSSPSDFGSPAVNAKPFELSSSNNSPATHSRTLPSRSHTKLLRSTPPYVSSPNYLQHSPSFMRQSPSSPSLLHPITPPQRSIAKSPQRPLSFSIPKFRPPYYDPANSPSTRNNQPHSSSPAPRSPVSTHSSPSLLPNGTLDPTLSSVLEQYASRVIDTPPNAPHIPSPLVTSPPPGISHLDLTRPPNGYATPPMHPFVGMSNDYFQMGFPPYTAAAPFDLRAIEYYARNYSPWPAMPAQLADLYRSLPQQQPPAIPDELQARQTSQSYNDEDLSVSSDCIY